MRGVVLALPVVSLVRVRLRPPPARASSRCVYVKIAENSTDYSVNEHREADAVAAHEPRGEVQGQAGDRHVLRALRRHARRRASSSSARTCSRRGSPGFARANILIVVRRAICRRRAPAAGVRGGSARRMTDDRLDASIINVPDRRCSRSPSGASARTGPTNSRFLPPTLRTPALLPKGQYSATGGGIGSLAARKGHYRRGPS